MENQHKCSPYDARYVVGFYNLTNKHTELIKWLLQSLGGGLIVDANPACLLTNYLNQSKKQDQKPIQLQSTTYDSVLSVTNDFKTSILADEIPKYECNNMDEDKFTLYDLLYPALNGSYNEEKIADTILKTLKPLSEENIYFIPGSYKIVEFDSLTDMTRGECNANQFILRGGFRKIIEQIARHCELNYIFVEFGSNGGCFNNVNVVNCDCIIPIVAEVERTTLNVARMFRHQLSGWFNWASEIVLKEDMYFRRLARSNLTREISELELLRFNKENPFILPFLITNYSCEKNKKEKEHKILPSYRMKKKEAMVVCYLDKIMRGDERVYDDIGEKLISINGKHAIPILPNTTHINMRRWGPRRLSAIAGVITKLPKKKSI